MQAAAISQERARYVYSGAATSITYTTLSLVSPFRLVRVKSEADVLPWATAAVEQACEVEPINDPVGYIARLHDVLGPWAFGETTESARSELESVLIGWALLKLEDGDSDIPVMGGMSLY